MIRAAVALVVLLFTAKVRSETVEVKYRGTVDLKTFECRDTPRSSVIQRVCYDKAQSYMVISLKGVYYHYCELPPATFDGLMGAPSMGQFFNQNIKGSGTDGPFDCRTHRIPRYSAS
jgi:KTSC domain